jgi:predicted alpha/beta superfamily hydrolase
MNIPLPICRLTDNPGFSPRSHNPRSTRPTRYSSALMTLACLVLFSAAAFGQAPVVSTLTIKSNVLGEDRVILVRTPDGYETSKQAYPVIYLTDGNAHIGHTSSTAEFLARNGRMSEMIVVGINNTDRQRDLSPSKPKNTGATGAPQFPTAGGADKFLQFIETELIPEIEKRYRVLPYRVLAGHSLGGLFAVHAMLSRPELFKSYVSVSPNLNWDNQLLIKRAEDFFKTRKEMNATLFMTIANEGGELDDAYHQMKQLLTKTQVKGFEWEAKEMPDEDHGSVVLRSHYYGLRKIYDGWQMPRDPDSGAIAGGMKEVEAHFNKLSQKFGYAVPIPESLINQMGYQALFGNQMEEAVRIFKMNIERYPNSANPYDSLAEAYERDGKIDLATPLYEKAQALGKQNNDPNAALFKANFERASEKLKTEMAKKAADPAKKTQ